MSENLPEHIGPYQILREAGRGGISTVYEAVDTRIGRVVGVKVLSGLPHLSDEERQQQTARLFQEGRAVAGLSHPNIVTVFDVGELPVSDDGTPPLPYLVMEFLRGETLRERLNRVGRLSPPDATLMLDQAAQGLHAAHRAGIVHRDIKPGNIMLLPDGGVKIMDFGVAQRQETVPKYDIGLPDSLSAANAHPGSSAYLSPEQARGEAAEVTAASDIWSLGVVLYEMLSGENPFASDSGRDDAEATRNRILTMRPAPPPNTGASVRRVLERAMDPQPQNRFPTAPALADAFRMAWVTDNAPALPADGENDTEEAAAAAVAVAAAAAATAFPIPAASPPEEPTPVFPEPAMQPPTPPLPVSPPVAEPYLPAAQQHRARRRASWLVPALLALAVFGLAVSLPLLLERQKGGGTERPAEPTVAVATGPSSANNAAASGRTAPDTEPARVSSRPSVKQLPQQQPKPKTSTSGRPADTSIPTGESRQPPPPGPVVVTEKPQPTPAKPAAESGSERPVPVKPMPPPPGPRGARAPAAVAGPTVKPEAKEDRTPEEEARTSPAPAEAEGESVETLTFLGEWRGSHTGREATLYIDREEPGGAFFGTLTVQAANGRVVLDVTGKLDDERGEPRVILRERRILEQPVRRSWDLGVNEGRLTEGGGMSGTGRDSRGRKYQWQFRR